MERIKQFWRRQQYLWRCYRGSGGVFACAWLYLRHGVLSGDFLY